MKNQKQIFKGVAGMSFMLFLALNMTFALSSCGGDDDDNDGSSTELTGTTSEKLCRSWSLKSVKVNYTNASGGSVVSFTDSLLSLVAAKQYAWDKTNDPDFDEDTWQYYLSNYKFFKQIVFYSGGNAKFFYEGSGSVTDAWQLKTLSGTTYVLSQYLANCYPVTGNVDNQSSISFTGRTMTVNWTTDVTGKNDNCVYNNTNKSVTLTFKADY